ncbi:hypothetical protein [Streptomyces sp. CNQ085]|uniref:hypothetical protein n=1 Tax=Streptomyces sp. CNQ085 TaxID=2886944 RepID=UPI001F50EDB7|nr:hypothetical protein [Streptomyces sp. CNQ085]MCI0386198.1 hypothetical protein [Streptomyces sp. CNQ085]
MTAQSGVAALATELDNTQTQLITTQRVVAQHIADGLTAGGPTAVLARSLATELDAAGVPIDQHITRAGGGR